MDAAALMIFYTLHSVERRAMRRPIVEAAAREEMKSAPRGYRLGRASKDRGSTARRATFPQRSVVTKPALGATV